MEGTCYAGEASSYRVLEEWAGLGLGSAPVPRSKLTSPSTPHRVLSVDGDEVEIFYEAAWSPASPLAPQLKAIVAQISSAAA